LYVTAAPMLHVVSISCQQLGEKPTTLTWADPAADGLYQDRAHDSYSSPLGYGSMAGRPAYAPYAPYSPGLASSQQLRPSAYLQHAAGPYTGLDALAGAGAGTGAGGEWAALSRPAEAGGAKGSVQAGLGGAGGAGYLKPSNAWY
jgi:hypothetical protein